MDEVPSGQSDSSGEQPKPTQDKQEPPSLKALHDSFGAM